MDAWVGGWVIHDPAKSPPGDAPGSASTRITNFSHALTELVR